MIQLYNRHGLKEFKMGSSDHCIQVTRSTTRSMMECKHGILIDLLVINDMVECIYISVYDIDQWVVTHLGTMPRHLA